MYEMDKIIEIRIKKHVRDYLKRQVEKFSQKQNFGEQIVNPFWLALIKSQLNVETKQKLARFLVFYGKTKGMTGSFGLKLQEIAGEFSHEAPKKGFHLRIKKGQKIYNVIVVSGPQHNTSNVAKYLSKMETSKKDFPGEIPVFGICYGSVNTLKLRFGNSIRTALKNEKIFIGKDFWQFISGDKDCRDKVLAIIEDEAQKFAESDEYDSIYDTLLKQSEALDEYLSEMYGDDPKKFWKNFFRDIYI